tara:strand:+ start:1610 stop:3724 length:2115 start_codon:yes stop_codon:yes gene_type:complete
MKRLESLGVDLFRINLSHTKLKDLSSLIRHIQDNTSVPICLDTEGAQVRTGDFVQNPIEFRENTKVRVCCRSVPGNENTINLSPREIVKDLRLGDFLSIDFNSVLAQVVERDGDDVVLWILTGGVVGPNKAVTIERDISLPPLSEKDIRAIRIGRELRLSNFALSFANKPSDVKEIRELAGNDGYIISKIESLSGLSNLESIAELSDALLIDRGDLSRQIPLEYIPQVQKHIIKVGKKSDRPVYVATNLLESMVSNRLPTRAEVNDIYNTLLDGADGLVLAAETAIGMHPIGCASMVFKVVQNFEDPDQSKKLSFPMEPISLLIEPHGGRLVQRYADSNEKREARNLRHVQVTETVLLDCEQIAHGTYSPLRGFMDSRTLNSVLDNSALPDGTVWPMPILLPVNRKDADGMKIDETVALKGSDGVTYATIEVSEIFELDRSDIAERWFGTTSREHPGVAWLFDGGEVFLAGEIKLLERQPSAYRHFELTPVQSRFIFAQKGWSQIIGFHTRNPVHRAHEYIQKKALDLLGADGLFISPVVGPKKVGDFRHQHIMRSYQTMLEFGLYPQGKAMLGGFATYSRYAGPREAVFTALCRKNMGCSHFIIGRDHTGVGAFYAKDANQELFNKVGDIGIEPIFFPAIGYNPKLDIYQELEGNTDCREIDGTRIRAALGLGERVEDWMMRDRVQESLLEITQDGESMFIES